MVIAARESHHCIDRLCVVHDARRTNFSHSSSTQKFVRGQTVSGDLIFRSSWPGPSAGAVLAQRSR